MAQIEIDRVRHTYRPPRGKPVLALEDVSLEVREREFLALATIVGSVSLTIVVWVIGYLAMGGPR